MEYCRLCCRSPLFYKHQISDVKVSAVNYAVLQCLGVEILEVLLVALC